MGKSFDLHFNYRQNTSGNMILA